MPAVSNFNSHAHVERDWINKYNKNCIDISTHTLTWSVTFYTSVNYFSCSNFNSHAHVERDNMNGFNVNMSKISTHTLTWSVTSAIAFANKSTTISTHTLTWSVTIMSILQERLY